MGSISTFEPLFPTSGSTLLFRPFSCFGAFTEFGPKLLGIRTPLLAPENTPFYALFKPPVLGPHSFFFRGATAGGLGLQTLPKVVFTVNIPSESLTCQEDMHGESNCAASSGLHQVTCDLFFDAGFGPSPVKDDNRPNKSHPTFTLDPALCSRNA